jgi:hypothetical protein
MVEVFDAGDYCNGGSVMSVAAKVTEYDDDVEGRMRARSGQELEVDLEKMPQHAAYRLWSDAFSVRKQNREGKH